MTWNSLLLLLDWPFRASNPRVPGKNPPPPAPRLPCQSQFILCNQELPICARHIPKGKFTVVADSGRITGTSEVHLAA
jgi:hypothetical protein